MDGSILSKVQQIALQISGSVFHLEKENIAFNPAEREFLLSAERQQYQTEYSIPVRADLSLYDHLVTTCSEIADEVRALRHGSRLWHGNLGENHPLEKLYAMIEGENYVPPSPYRHGELATLHCSLDIYDNLELLEDTVVMYPEVAPQEKRQGWRDILDNVKADFLNLIK